MSEEIKSCPFCGIIPFKMSDNNTLIFHDPTYENGRYKCKIIGYQSFPIIEWNDRYVRQTSTKKSDKH